MQERIDFVVECLGSCLLKSQINRAFRQKFDPEASPATVLDYVSRAREQMAENLARSRQEHAQKALSGIEAIIRNPKTDQRTKIRAYEVLIQLVGAAEAQKFVVHHDNELAKADIDRRIDAVFGIVRRAGQNGANGNGNGVDHEAEEATA